MVSRIIIKLDNELMDSYDWEELMGCLRHLLKHADGVGDFTLTVFSIDSEGNES